MLGFYDPGFALIESVALTVHFQDVHIMCEPVQQCACEAFGAEGLGPFFEREIAGDQG